MIYKIQEISINILNNKNIIGLFLIETKLKRFDKNIQIPQYAYRGTKNNVEHESGGISF